MSITQARYWQIYVRPEIAEIARKIAQDVVLRLHTTDLRNQAATLATQQSNYRSVAGGNPLNMARGELGLAVLCAFLDSCFPDEGWDRYGHQHLQAAVKDLEDRYETCGSSLFYGRSGLAFATRLLSRQGQRYQHLLSILEQKLFPDIMANAQHVINSAVHGCQDPLYDVISGLSGIGAYLLCSDHPEASRVLHTVLASLIYLAEEQENVPHWYIPLHLAPKNLWSLDLGDGYVNCGLAHGIPGPLALLALTRSSGIAMPGLDKTIASIADWLVDHHLEDEWGANWPNICIIGETADPPVSSRTAWCYGTPGVARALWLAGEALHRKDYQEIAIRGMQSVYRQPLSTRRIDSPCFCHGVAGLLHITLRFARDTGDPCFIEAANSLSEQLIGLYQPDSLLGYRHLESADVFLDTPWLLDGAAGVALVLLAASTPCNPGWDRLFLLS